MPLNSRKCGYPLSEKNTPIDDDWRETIKTKESSALYENFYQENTAVMIHYRPNTPNTLVDDSLFSFRAEINNYDHSKTDRL